MSIPNRTVSITGVFAADASTTIPSSPVSGVAYRNTAMTGTVIREGWAYKTIVDSANFNQALYEYSSVTAQIEKYGFLPWSNLTDYVQGSVCLGSNGKIYQAKQATGPSSTAYDPTTTPTVWDPIILGVTEFLFHHIWTDYQLNRQEWLRADTFSWQNGTVYTNAYNHLVADYNGGTTQTETVGSYTITYKLATDGHKITTDETNVDNIYNESGVAWYYILDTTNQRFKLPRTKYGFVGLRDTVGKYVAPGLPNISGTYGFGDRQTTSFNVTGAFYDAGYVSNTRDAEGKSADIPYLGFDASRSNPIYGASNTVQQRATQMYLYFYVGQFSQSATEQTAGLNSELFNGKVDLNAANLSTAGKSLVSGLGMPSNMYIDLTLGASGSTYTAPANGYFCLNCQIQGDNNYIAMVMNNRKVFQWCSSANQEAGLIIQAKKGDVMELIYNSNPYIDTFNDGFKFIYAEGEVV